MKWMSVLLFIVCSACGIAHQPASNRTVAAFEVPLPTSADKQAFLILLRREAGVAGFHVDAAKPDELRQLSDVSPISFNASVWRGKNDDEVVASAMDFQDHVGRVWLSFAEGSEPRRFADFRRDLMPKIRQRWPATASLPIMPNGAIPLTEDLRRTPSGYQIIPSAAAKYQVPVRD